MLVYLAFWKNKPTFICSCSNIITSLHNQSIFPVFDRWQIIKLLSNLHHWPDGVIMLIFSFKMFELEITVVNFSICVLLVSTLLFLNQSLQPSLFIFYPPCFSYISTKNILDKGAPLSLLLLAYRFWLYWTGLAIMTN